jgi:hypothetical protein
VSKATGFASGEGRFFIMRFFKNKVSKQLFFVILILTLGLLATLSTNAFAQAHYDFTYPDRASLTAAGWDFLALTKSGTIRDTEQRTGAVVSYDQVVHPGVLRIPCDVGDLWGNTNNSRNSIFRDLPLGWTSIRLKLAAFAPTQMWQQAGLLAYQDDDNYVQVVRIYTNNNNEVEFDREVNASPTILRHVSQTATSNLYLRLDRDPATETITGYYSLNGVDWTSLGSVVQSLSHPRLGIFVGTSPSAFPNADVAWAEVLN